MSDNITVIEFNNGRAFFLKKEFSANCNLAEDNFDFSLECPATFYALSKGLPIYSKYSVVPIKKLNDRFHKIIKIENKKVFQEMKKICDECHHRQK